MISRFTGAYKMTSLKNVAIERLKKLPDDVSLEDIMYEINFISQVVEGLKDAEQGNTITTEELLKKIEQRAK
jgi:predicted transcriptional regulator